MKGPMKNQHAGFTLIEFIVALVVAAVVAAMVYSFFGSSLTQSGVPILRLQKTANLNQVMENIVADFNRLNALNLRYHWQLSTPYGLNAVVTPKTIPASPNGGHYYISTTAGTSGTTEPTWPITAGDTVADGGVTWTESGNMVWQGVHPYATGTIVVPINNTGHYYKCTTAGTSRGTPPAWPTATGGTVTETGGPTWTEVGTILDRSNTGLTDSILIDSIKYHLENNPGRYGTGYTVVLADTKFIQFNGTTEVNAGASGTSSEKNILKVTIKSNDSAETVTQLLTIR